MSLKLPQFWNMTGHAKQEKPWLAQEYVWHLKTSSKG
jgi:hypothetical protein